MTQHFRYSSRLIVVVHSWQSAKPIDLSAHIVSVEMTKEIKRVGSASIVLAPGENWFNRLYANDMISVYYDSGDGVSGWEWAFFGYIDRVARVERVVSDAGEVASAFTITCSDFMKAVDRSEVIFRAELAQRLDWSIDARFAFSNKGGMGTMTRGLTTQGTPDTVVESLLGLFMGYGAQFQLPPSFSPWISVQKKRVRANRIQRALLKLPGDVRDAVTRMGFGQLFEYNQVQNPKSIVERLLALAVKTSPNDTRQQIADSLTVQYFTTRLLSYANILEDSAGQPTSMWDAMDQSFVEGKCIDGFAPALNLQQSVGALSNLAYARCNEMVNELFFDLRPVAGGSTGEDDAMTGGFVSVGSASSTTAYSRNKDMLGVNVDGFGGQKATVPGVQYVPTMVMREYPYSVAPGLDASGYKTVPGLLLGPVPFGPVFREAKTGDSTARVFYDYFQDGFPNGITAQPEWYPESARPYKHLDVATMRLADIVSMQVSRGDADAQNLLIISQSIGPNGIKVNLPDLIPIFNIASIARDGVRVRDASSIYYGFSATLPYSPQNQLKIAGGVYRWALLQDHWYQHNPEYLSGTITTRPRVDIRVGYRLDMPERAESYYVTKVSHSFAIMDNGAVRASSSFDVTRGQRTDPFPVYIPPSINTKNLVPSIAADVLAAGGGNRGQSGRLAKVFPVQGVKATATARGSQDSADTGNVTDSDVSDIGPYIAAGTLK
jgi:hypothetical protein